MQQQQQNLVFRQAMQQQEQQHQQPPQQQQQQINFQPGSGPHPIMTSNNLPNFPSTSGAPQQMRVQNMQMQPNPILQQAYLQYAMQQQAAQQQQQQQQQHQQKSHASLLAPQQQQQNNAATANALKVQELMTLQRNSNNSSGNSNNNNNNNPHMSRPTQPQTVNPPSANQLAMLQQIQMMQAWAKEQNLDLSVPANMNLVAQMFPMWQNATRMAAIQQQQKNAGESSGATIQGQQQQSQQQHQQMVMPSPGGSEGSASHGSNQNQLSEISGQQHGADRKSVV